MSSGRGGGGHLSVSQLWNTLIGFLSWERLTKAHLANYISHAVTHFFFEWGQESSLLQGALSDERAEGKPISFDPRPEESPRGIDSRPRLPCPCYLKLEAVLLTVECHLWGNTHTYTHTRRHFSRCTIRWGHSKARSETGHEDRLYCSNTSFNVDGEDSVLSVWKIFKHGLHKALCRVSVNNHNINAEYKLRTMAGLVVR